jgi:hypothetical protein
MMTIHWRNLPAHHDTRLVTQVWIWGRTLHYTVDGERGSLQRPLVELDRITTDDKPELDGRVAKGNDHDA